MNWRRKSGGVPRAWLVATAVGLLGCLAVQAQQPAAGLSGPKNEVLEEELRYIAGLRELRLFDYADLLLPELKRRYPDASARLKVIELEGRLVKGEFDAVKALIAAEPQPDAVETWVMKLALADAYYAFGKYADAKGLYEAFFKRFEKPGPDVAPFFMESSYKYAQMLIYLKEHQAALAAYRRVLSVPLEPHIERQCKAEMSELAIKVVEADEQLKKEARAALLKDAAGWADGLLWQQDIWFGKAIVIKSHILMLNGKAEDAKKLVEDYMPQLRLIHDSLVQQEQETGEPLTRVSPMAECRYLLAVMLQDEATKLMKVAGFDRDQILSLLIGTKREDGKGRQGNGAYQHFINVFLGYAESSWAAEAGERAEQIRELIARDFGGNITTQVTPELLAKVRKIQFQDARMLFNQQQFESAIARYLFVINRFPEEPESISALGELARCYYETVQVDPLHELYGDLVVSHLAERFGRNRDLSSPAGDELVRLAEASGEAGLEDRRSMLYDAYFRNMSDHPMAATYLFTFGERHFRDKDFPTALGYYRQVAENYTNSPLSFDALNRMGSIYSETHELTNEMAVLSVYIGRLEARPKPGHALMNARFRMAQANKNLGVARLRGTTNAVEQAQANRELSAAAVAYNNLAAVLNDPNNPYQSNDDEKKQNATLREASLYNTAYCLAQINQPAERVPALREKAIESFEDLVKSFPQSAYAPAALIQIGSIWTGLRQTEKAEAALGRLRRDYPDSPEAKSALPLWAKNLMEMGMRAEAIAIYRQMFTESAKYSSQDILMAGQALTDAKEYENALQAFDRVLAGNAQNPVLAAPAKLGRARVLARQEQFADALRELKAFVKEYEKLSLVVDANLLLSEVASEAGMRERNADARFDLFNLAVDSMKQVKRYRTSPVEMGETDLAVGRVLARKAKAEAKFGTPEKLVESRGKAIVAFLGILNTPPGNVALAPVLEQAYYECVPLMIEHGAWSDVFDECAAYVREFPRGRYVAAMRAWQNEASINLGTRPKDAPPPVAAATNAVPVSVATP